MIQFNLLPDVKIEFIKAKRIKRIVSTAATVTTATCVVVLVLLYTAVQILQAQHLKNLSSDIETYSSELEEIEELDKVLTIQNQLGNLTALHERKPTTSRLYRYVSQLTPVTLKYQTITFNFVENKLELTGTADSIKTVNQFIDTLKFTTFKADLEEETDGVKQIVSTEEGKAFSDVVLNTFGRNNEGANFKVNLLFDARIFDNKLAVTLNVPDTVTTRSVTERPGNLFQKSEELETPEEAN